MGLRPSELIEQAAPHLLAVLQTQARFSTRRPTTAAEEANARLWKGIGISVEDGEWYSAEALVDNAAAQLEQQGIVELKWLETRLLMMNLITGSLSPTQAVRFCKPALGFRFTTQMMAASTALAAFGRTFRLLIGKLTAPLTL